MRIRLVYVGVCEILTLMALNHALSCLSLSHTHTHSLSQTHTQINIHAHTHSLTLSQIVTYANTALHFLWPFVENMFNPLPSFSSSLFAMAWQNNKQFFHPWKKWTVLKICKTCRTSGKLHGMIHLNINKNLETSCIKEVGYFLRKFKGSFLS